ncbi:hypothetical protein G7K71_01145 [Desulfofundulus sp. TPOSR]|uniref:LIM zinc-binding protein n=1 Tax=Desulfofundulus kuznetsovii (strain DSM 6115 / VKM B-1805 / 17) TaxID=760568 RepID=A0AAU8PSN9_DESK7|nr:hypothetical protein [Desulfofundulus sp. TPOSR]AEG14891.1 hypothetical protein Desku_1308 [Desulfofundulus kuznetsovii DSM 6115]NHM25641.1 hypothetical protein [Desulfofundulus sp. TPOSR]
MKCVRCQEEVPPQDSYDYYGQTLCEDCYIAALQPPKPCDPTAVASAKATRTQLGQTGTAGLTPLQKRIYEYIKEKGKATKEELASTFNLPQWELEKQFAVLRHCELVRATKEGQQIYFTLW